METILNILFTFLLLAVVQVSCQSFTRRDRPIVLEIKSVTVGTKTECFWHCKREPTCVYIGFLGDQCNLYNTQEKCGAPAQDLDPDWEYFALAEQASNCKELYNQGVRTSGVYTVYPSWESDSGIDVYCEMEVDGGGWLVFVKRNGGSEDFDRTWTEYANGFGNKSGEFWLGNDNIHKFTNSCGCTLMRTDYTSTSDVSYSQILADFRVSDEQDKYRLSLTIGETDPDVWIFHDGMQFTTKDSDNDGHSSVNCASFEGTKGAWWFKDCRHSLPTAINGKIYAKRVGENVKTVDLKIKPCY